MFKNTVFTLHFATINTRSKRNFENMSYKFTLHFATINTDVKVARACTSLNLHYTLLLLILVLFLFFIGVANIYITLCYY